MIDRLPPDLVRRIRFVGLDVDGVLTDGGVYLGQAADGTPVELKRFDITDGLGIKMLARAGLRVVLVSGRVSAATRLRAMELNVPCYEDAGANKIPVLEGLRAEHGLEWDEMAFVGDDLADPPQDGQVGLPVAVANAVPEVRAAALWQTSRAGGNGAVREFAEALLRARGEWSALVETYCRDREAGSEADGLEISAADPGRIREAGEVR